VTARPWRPPVYDVHPSDQAIREAVERARETEERHPGGVLDAYSPVELDRDLMIRDGWPRLAAEQLAVQHAREQANREAGQ
jgi:hypothetical protein